MTANDNEGISPNFKELSVCNLYNNSIMIVRQ